jgi:hypothetical protein
MDIKNKPNTMANEKKAHVFELANLGIGPFRLHHVTAEGGKCQYCNTPIVFRFYIKSADDRIFFVGSDCVMKTRDEGLIRVVEAEVKKHQSVLRKKRENAKLEALKNFLSDANNIAFLASKPHPVKYWAKIGKTLKDHVDYIMRLGSKTEKLRLAKDLLGKNTRPSIS